MNTGQIIVVMGGTSSEAEVSRRTGKAIFQALRTKGYNVEKLELNPTTFAEDIKKSDPAIVFNAVHGQYGEDGALQGTLEMLGIPYTGSGVLSAAITMNKVMSKRLFQAAQIATPQALTYNSCDKKSDLVSEITQNFTLPVVIKAATQGSSIGVYIVENIAEIQSALDEAFKYSEEVLVEEFIKGREMTVAVCGDGAKCEAYPVIEITTVSGRYDYVSKYTIGASTHIVPAKISPEQTKEVQELAKRTFSVCGCKGVSRIDVMLGDDGKFYVIEVNSVPGMTETSLVPDAARAAGIEFSELCEQILRTAGYDC